MIKPLEWIKYSHKPIPFKYDFIYAELFKVGDMNFQLRIMKSVRDKGWYYLSLVSLHEVENTNYLSDYSGYIRINTCWGLGRTKQCGQRFYQDFINNGNDLQQEMMNDK